MVLDTTKWTLIDGLIEDTAAEAPNGCSVTAGGGQVVLAGTPTSTTGGDGQLGIKHTLRVHQPTVTRPAAARMQGLFRVYGGLDPPNNGALRMEFHFCTAGQTAAGGQAPDRNVSVVYGHQYIGGESQVGFYLRQADEGTVTVHGKDGSTTTLWTYSDLGVEDPTTTWVPVKVERVNNNWTGYVGKASGAWVQLGPTIEDMGEADTDDDDMQVELKMHSRAGTYPFSFAYKPMPGGENSWLEALGS
ncbi:MAG: hypothetical protein VW405_07505 [Rhodospirillaceae bacterium]